MSSEAEEGNSFTNVNALESCSKKELIAKIKSLTAHNFQLRNIISKSDAAKPAVQIDNKEFDFSRCTYRHVLLRLLYLGWNYKGFVVQENTSDTVEHHLFAALKKTKLIKDRATANYHRCGRTDKGVSSFGQTISITIRSNLSIPNNDSVEGEINYCKVLNRVLPENIQCIAWSPVNDNFSARFDCKSRTYKYYFPKAKLNIEKMKEASIKLLGSHDFRNLCKMDVLNGVVEFTRNITSIKIEPNEPSNYENYYTMYVISIQANAFLWHEIRCIMGVLFLIGQDKEEPTVIDELLDTQKNPRKPEYSLASEIPLNLFYCEYEGIQWKYDKMIICEVVEKLCSLWEFTAIKEHMMKDMINSLMDEIEGTILDRKCLSENLLQGVKPKKHILLMKRKTCLSLEEKISNFSKRKKIDVIIDKE